MQPLCWILTAAALMAGPQKPDDAANRAQATLHRVANLTAEQQKAWLEQFEKRYDWAVRLTKKPADAQTERARVAALLRQSRISWSTLVELLKQLDQREKAAISRLVRQYRSEVYETFQKQPKKLVERQEAWYRVWQQWETAGSPPEQQDRLINWLASAIHNSLADSIGPLPADPKFGPGEDLAPLLVQKEPMPEKPAAAPAPPTPPAEPALPPSAMRPLVETYQPVPIFQGPHDSRALAITLRVPNAAVVRHVPVEPPAVLAAVRPPVAVPPRAAVKVPAPDINAVAAAYPPRMIKNSKRFPPPGSVSPADTAVAMNTARDNVARAVTPTAPLAGRPPAELPRPSTDPFDVAVDQADRPQLELHGLPRTVFKPIEPGAAESQPRTPGGQDLVAMLPRQVPTSMLPENVSRRSLGEGLGVRASGSGVDHAEAPPALPPETPAPPAAPVAASEHAEVNVEELAARIAGVNASLRSLEAELQEKQPWSADRLDNVLSRLDILVLRQRDLTLFRDLITPAEQKQVGQIESPRQAITALASHIAEVRRTTTAGDDADQPKVLKHLDDLSDRLATLTMEK